MTLEELESSYVALKEQVNKLYEIEYKNITEYDKLPTIDFEDTILVVTRTDYTGRATVEQLMEYLNKNLRNFICWKPVVTNSTLRWERSSNDEAPGELRFEDIMFPMASNDTNGMMTSDDYKKLKSIDNTNIVYNGALTEILTNYALKEHEHEQYQLIADMPTKLTQFNNDAGFITVAAIPTKVSAFANDAKYLKLEDIPMVSSTDPGFMTPELLAIVSTLVETTVTTDNLDIIIKNLEGSFPTKVSAFENDSDYMPRSLIYDTFGELGAVNIIRNGEFRFLMYDADTSSYVVDGWFAENGSIEQYTEDPDYDYAGKIEFTPSTIVGAALITANGRYNTISFLARAENSAKFRAYIGDGSAETTIGTTWSRYTLTIKDNGTNPLMYLRLTLSDTDVTSNTLYITQVKVEKGSLDSVYYPSYPDLKDLIKVPATLDTYGAVLPDGDTIGFNEVGKLRVMPKAINTLRIDDATPSTSTLYSSSKIEDRLNTRAPLVDGKVPPEYLPEYLDDVIEGKMTIDSDGNYIFTVDAGQYGPSEPSKGILYLDTESNIAWRWTGSTYLQCTTDKLGGAVLVKYNEADNYMYFVFPK